MLPTFDIPPVGPHQAKVWGSTQLLFAHYGVECHLIHFAKGRFCSKHRHEHKWNRFVVLEGSLSVEVFQTSGDFGADSTTIRSGQVTDVPPQTWHRFTGIENGTALEFYWTMLEAGDIERADVGGIVA